MLDKGPYNDKGQRHGLWITYHSSGMCFPLSKGMYKNNKRQGEWEWYYANGQLSFKGLYINDEPIGYRIVYAYNGNIDKKRYYAR